MKYWTKRVISLILCVMMLVTAIPQQVYANTNLSNIFNVSLNVDDTLENSDEENSEILEELKALGGDSHTTEAVLQQLYNMGLLDDEGALVTSTQIMVDGTAMSLEEVKALIEAPGTDLGKKVSVDGTQITLKYLIITAGYIWVYTVRQTVKRNPWWPSRQAIPLWMPESLTCLRRMNLSFWISPAL